MRTISSAMQNYLAGSVTALTTCMRIDRTDGNSLAFCSTIVPLVIGGVTYQPVEAINASNLQQSTSSVDNLEISGVLDAGGINQLDIDAGLYDQAKVTVFLVSWDDVLNGGYTMGAVILTRGIVGQIQVNDGGFTLEVRSLAQRLQQILGRCSSITCRASEFNGPDCQYVATTGGTINFNSNNITAVSSDQFTLTVNISSQPSNAFTYGVLIMRSGGNNGLSRKIKQHTQTGAGAVMLLEDEFPYDVTTSDTCDLILGCSRTWERCKQLNNAINFQGEPHLPGNDKMLTVGRP